MCHSLLLFWGFIDSQCCNYYHLPSDFSYKFQSFITIFHHKLLTREVRVFANGWRYVKVHCNAHMSFSIATILASHGVTINHGRHVGRSTLKCGISGNVKRTWMVNVTFHIELFFQWKLNCESKWNLWQVPSSSSRLHYHKTSQFTNDSSHFHGLHTILAVPTHMGAKKGSILG